MIVHFFDALMISNVLQLWTFKDNQLPLSTNCTKVFRFAIPDSDLGTLLLLFAEITILGILKDKFRKYSLSSQLKYSEHKFQG